MSACNYAEGANHSWTWSSSDPSPTDHYAEHINCPDLHGSNGGTPDQEGGLSTTDALGLSTGAPPGANAAWTFTAPSNTTITAITYERYLGHEDDTSNTWSPALRADGTIIQGQTCTVTLPSVGCFLGGPPGEGGEPATITGLTAHELSFGVTCVAPLGQECVTGATEHPAWAAMYGATVTINDPTPPTLGTPTGALWGPGEPNGYHKGTENITVSAQDVGGGVQSIILAADGHTIETYHAPCNFTLPKPCPSSTEPQTLTLPTTTLTDGTTHSYPHRDRRRRQRISNRLQAGDDRQQPTTTTCRADRQPNTDRQLDVRCDLDRSRRRSRANHRSDLSGLPRQRLGCL